jgi:hypothetical protein
MNFGKLYLVPNKLGESELNKFPEIHRILISNTKYFIFENEKLLYTEFSIFLKKNINVCFKKQKKHYYIYIYIFLYQISTILTNIYIFNM